MKRTVWLLLLFLLYVVNVYAYSGAHQSYNTTHYELLTAFNQDKDYGLLLISTSTTCEYQLNYNPHKRITAGKTDSLIVVRGIYTLRYFNFKGGVLYETKINIKGGDTVSVHYPTQAETQPSRNAVINPPPQDKMPIAPPNSQAADVVESKAYRQLYYAVTQNNRDKVKKILQQNPTFVNVRNIDGQTLLHYAAKRNVVELTQLLLDSGADPSLTNSQGETPLHIAALSRSNKIVRLYCNKYKTTDYINQKDYKGNTALHSASYSICWDCIKTIKAAGGITSILNYKKQKPKDVLYARMPVFVIRVVMYIFLGILLLFMLTLLVLIFSFGAV